MLRNLAIRLRKATIPAGLCAAIPVFQILLGTGLQGQQPARPTRDGVVKPVASADLQKSGIELDKSAGEGGQPGKVVRVRWATHEIPLVPPVVDLDCGLSADGNHLVILAGGVRESLDVYVVGKKSGDIYRFQTDGGRRLSRSFNDGQGSWPWIEGAHLILFGYEKAGKFEFRAVSQQGFVHGERHLDLGVKGVEVSSDPDQGYVRVRFKGASDDLEFAHPLAPRLELVEHGNLNFRSVQLGSSSRRLLQVKNSGKRALKVKPTVRIGDFELDIKGSRTLRLEPGETKHIAVVFRPKNAGRYVEQLSLEANGAIPGIRVNLRGRGIAPPRPGEPRADSSNKVVATSRPGADQPAVDGTGSSAQPAAHEETIDVTKRPTIRHIRLHPLGGREVLVLGQLVSAAATRQQLVLRNEHNKVSVSVWTDELGRFHARMPARAFEGIDVAKVAAADVLSPWKSMGEVQPQVEIAGDELLVRCLPNQEFLLVAVPPAPEPKGGGARSRPSTRPAGRARLLRSDRVLGSWRGRAMATGLMRYPLALLRRGKPTAPMAVILVTQVEGEERNSPRVTIPPADR